MQSTDIQRLHRIRQLLNIAILLLVIGEIVYFLQGALDYIWAVVGAAVVLALRIAAYKWGKKGGWLNVLFMLLPLFVIFYPLLYVIFDLLNGSGVLGIGDLFFLSIFLLPILMLLYASYSLKRLLAENADV